MNIGFVGLGVMGRPMAEHLIAAGHQLIVWSRRQQSAAPLLARGATLAADVAQLARDSAIVCSNVTADADVIALAADILPALGADAMHIDFSTISASSARQLAARYAAAGRHFIDAPVSGGASGARAASLAIMWGGPPQLAPRLEPVLRHLGETIVHIGPAGSGQVAKACNQMVMVAAIAASAEAARLAAANGVDFSRVRTALQGGSAASRVLEVFGDKMLRRDFSAGVAARLHHKDFAAILGEAAQAAIPVPVAAAVMQQLNALMAAGWGDADSSRLLAVLEKTTAAPAAATIS